MEQLSEIFMVAHHYNHRENTKRQSTYSMECALNAQETDASQSLILNLCCLEETEEYFILDFGLEDSDVSMHLCLSFLTCPVGTSGGAKILRPNDRWPETLATHNPQLDDVILRTHGKKLLGSMYICMFRLYFSLI